MENNQPLLQGHTDMEKGAYLGAIASIATADRQASDVELENLTTLCDAAGLSAEQRTSVLEAAHEISTTELNNCLNILKNSDLKHSLIADLISFAKSDSDYSQAEQESIKNIATYLDINQNQYALLEQFSDKVSSTSATPEEPGFLSKLGIEDKLKSAGINTSSLVKGLIAVAAPIIISKMMHRNTQSTQQNNGGVLGNLGGLGNIFGGNNNSNSSGGLGSIISMLNGGGGFGKAGSLLGSLFK